MNSRNWNINLKSSLFYLASQHLVIFHKESKSYEGLILIFFKIQLILCNIKILSAAIASGFFPITSSTAFYIYLLNLVVWWLTKVCLYTDHWKSTSFYRVCHEPNFYYICYQSLSFSRDDGQWWSLMHNLSNCSLLVALCR